MAKPRPFRIRNHETEDDILQRLEPWARVQWENVQTSLSKNINDWRNRIPWLHNRAMMTIAQELPVFRYFDSIQPAMVPQDGTKVKDWLILQHTRSMQKHGARVDFNAPIEFAVCIVPDAAMDLQKDVELPVNREQGLVLQCPVSTLPLSSPSRETLFGVSQAKIDEFVERICQVQVEGRRVRSNYRILWKSSHVLAENFLWTNLSNNVSYDSIY